MVYEINRQVLPTAPSPTTTHLDIGRSKGGVSLVVHLMLVLMLVLLGYIFIYIFIFLYKAMLMLIFSTREKPMLISTSSQQAEGRLRGLT